ncbi:MAG: Yip1 family protein [Melioribacteraceae bacterium]
MDEMQNQDAPKMSSVDDSQEEHELSHTDKLVGVFSEPAVMFSKTAKFPPKTSDWIVPLLITIAASILAIIVSFSNPDVRQEMRQENEKQIQKMVDEGQLTQEQADQQAEMTENFMGGPFFYVTTSLSTIIVMFIFFFLVTGVFHLSAKLIFKGDATYKDSMVAYGLPYYILIIQIIVGLILTLAMGKAFRSTSVAAFLSLDKQSIVHFILSKIDIFSIWFYVVVGIGFAKMSKSADTKKYIILIVGLWLGFALLFFALGKYLPFLERFNAA